MSLVAGAGVLLAACARQPAAGWHTSGDAGTVQVRPGDTVLGIAHRYGVPSRSIIAANRLAPPYRLFVGQTLLVPGGYAAAPVVAVRPRPLPPWAGASQAPQPPPDTAAERPPAYATGPIEAARPRRPPPWLEPSPPPQPLPYAAEERPPVYATEPIETSRPRSPPPWLQPSPPLPSDTAAERPPAYPTGPIGAARPRPLPPWLQPSPPLPATADARPSGDAARIDSPEVPPRERPATRLGARAAEPHPAVHDTVAAAVPLRETPPAAKSRGSGFVWPVRGRVVEAFGNGSSGTQNDGINIAVRAGAPVCAAAAGEVVYVGNELRGYGNLVLIKHGGGYLTAYAHNSTLLVRKGEHVARGQTIALVGATGQVREPQLHFEIRYGRDPVDPMRYLPPQQQVSISR